MILDKIENINRYGIDLKFIEEDLKKGTFNSGKYEIEGTTVFGIGLEYNTQESDRGVWEAHRKYLDIHLILEGEEIIELSDINIAISVREYEDDYELFDTVAQQRVHLKAGYFLVVFPDEVHKTSVRVKEAAFVKKKVFKKKIDS